jgi:hypothetical protein
MTLVLDAGHPNGRKMATLVIYGRPPRTSTFRGITTANRVGFEKALVRELEKIMLKALEPVTVRQIMSPDDLPTLLALGRFDTVLFYGHALPQVTIGPRGTRNEIVLQTAAGGAKGILTADDFAKALQAAPSVRTVAITGCASSSFAADLSTRTKGVRSGGFVFNRIDEIAGTEREITHFHIIPQPIKWW